jgi:phosphoribosylglycinamide formyltransferase-1
MHNIIVFASGGGTNTQAIINHFKNSTLARVALIVCNKPGAGVLNIAQTENIPYLLIDKKSFYQTLLLEQLSDYRPSLIVLAGFLWKIPESLIHAFPNKIINIHPALLPKYGGPGMYGQKVHQAVLNAHEKESGITIHFVNEHYDSGATILQAHCPVLAHDDEHTLATRIHTLEHFYFPLVIEFLIRQV